MSTTTRTPETHETHDGTRGGTGRRLAALTRANAVLLVRNRLTFVYAVALPLVPLVAIGFVGDEATLGRAAVSQTLLLALLFPVFYNLLSLFVTRRDELVLKRLRTGEARDPELLASLALPGCAITVVVMLLAVVVGAAVGLPLPVNPLLYAVTVLAGCAIFAGLALLTAAFTRTSEAAQVTSMPVIVLAVAGTLVDVFPARVADVVALTPVAAIDEMLSIGWFGRADGADVGFGPSFVEAGPPLLVLVVWTIVSLDLARRHLRWEPRA